MSALDYNDILNLIDKIENSSFEKFEIEFRGTKLILSKRESGNNVEAPVVGAIKTENISKAVDRELINEVKEINETKTPITILPKEKEEISGAVVKSPIVGTFYESSSPDTPAFASVGQKINKGDVLCIVEAMKVMNEVTSPYSGIVAEILVENEELVEFNKPLFIIEEK